MTHMKQNVQKQSAHISHMTFVKRCFVSGIVQGNCLLGGRVPSLIKFFTWSTHKSCCVGGPSFSRSANTLHLFTHLHCVAPLIYLIKHETLTIFHALPSPAKVVVFAIIFWFATLPSPTD